MTALPEPLEIGSADARVASPVPSDYSPPASLAPLSTARLGRGDNGMGWKQSVTRSVSAAMGGAVRRYRRLSGVRDGSISRACLFLKRKCAGGSPALQNVC